MGIDSAQGLLSKRKGKILSPARSSLVVLIQCGTPAILISECSCKAEGGGGSQGSAGAESEAAESPVPHLPQTELANISDGQTDGQSCLSSSLPVRYVGVRSNPSPQWNIPPQGPSEMHFSPSEPADATEGDFEF